MVTNEDMTKLQSDITNEDMTKLQSDITNEDMTKLQSDITNEDMTKLQSDITNEDMTKLQSDITNEDMTKLQSYITNEDMTKIQSDVDRLGEWAVENAMKIYPSKSKAVCFTRARVKGPLKYSLLGALIPEASSCKYLGVIVRSDLRWADHVNYKVEKAWKALHFTMRILK
jgi:hypothetical protein